MNDKTEFVQLGGAFAPPGIHTSFDFSVLIKEGEVFVIQGEERMEAGQDLIFAGFSGLAGSSVLLAEKKAALSSKFSESFLYDMERKMKESIPFQVKGERLSDLLSEAGTTALEAVGGGGAFAAFWKFLERFKTGAQIWLSDIPVRQETIEICEVFDINPYELYSNGCFLLAADYGKRLVCRLKELGIPAEIIGYVTKGPDRVIVTKEGRRFITKPQPDPLYGLLGYKEEAT